MISSKRMQLQIVICRIQIVFRTQVVQIIISLLQTLQKYVGIHLERVKYTLRRQIGTTVESVTQSKR